MADLNIDPNNLGSAPLVVKVVLVVLLFAVVVGAGIYQFVRPKVDELKKVAAEEPRLKTEFEEKQQDAANLQAYKDQLAEMEITFAGLLKQLPSSSEVDSLLIDISQTALNNGLKIDLFQPKAEISREFYSELPINLRLIGDYMQVSKFISDVAALPRIVTIANIDLKPQKENTKPGQPQNVSDVTLVMNAVARTYRYVEGE